jgi:integrase
MAYITSRNNRFYVVAYDGIDPATGRERRRWHPAGRSLADAEAIASSLNERPAMPISRSRDAVTVGGYLVETWLPERKRTVRATTFSRYEWIVAHYIAPTIGTYALRSIRAQHLNDLYTALVACGGRDGRPLSPKTVHEVHLIIRSALAQTTEHGLTRTNVALQARWSRPHARPRRGPETWTADEHAEFLAFATNQRLYPALYLTATTGMRRGEIVGLRWGDWNCDAHRLSISRTRQALNGRSAEFATKTGTSRRTVELDPDTERVLLTWQERQTRDGHPVGTRDQMFTNFQGEPLHPESISQLFARLIKRSGLPPIRYHDLRHTHASLLVADGVTVKAVAERLGHSHPSFTIHTYQHLLPGMSAEAAHRFAALIAR